MALVAYSDSEGSDAEAPIAPSSKPAAASAKPAFTKTNEPRRIKVDLPTLQPEPRLDGDVDASGQPQAKRARTSGAFGGFNSFLPAPKRPAVTPQGLKKGVNLKTSSEAAFSRAAPAATAIESNADSTAESGYDEFGNLRANDVPGSTSTDTAEKPKAERDEEPKIVGKATRFKPLSVANNKKKMVKKAKSVAVEARAPEATVGDTAQKTETSKADIVSAPPNVKRSLFSVPLQEEDAPEVAPEVHEPLVPAGDQPLPPQPQTGMAPSNTAANSLEAVAADLNLTPAERRQLFGRKGGKNSASIAHFNMDSEYAANEELRQAGEAAEHRAVKSIAPGKHSLQQLVNNARSNQDSIEDKWAEGRRNQGGSNYGWS